MIYAKVVGADATARGFLAGAETVERRSRAAERHYRQLLLSQVQARAPKRTGAYAASWGIDREEVGTNAPQGNRLEHGFHGIDSLGRRYSNPPQPHVRPAVDTVEPAFFLAEEAVVKSL